MTRNTSPHATPRAEPLNNEQTPLTIPDEDQQHQVRDLYGGNAAARTATQVGLAVTPVVLLRWRNVGVTIAIVTVSTYRPLSPRSL